MRFGSSQTRGSLQGKDLVQPPCDLAEANGGSHVLGLRGGLGDIPFQVSLHLFQSHFVDGIIDDSKVLLVQASLEVQQARQIRLGRGISGIKLERLFKLGNGLVQVSFTFPGDSKVEVGPGVVRLEFERQ